MSHISAYSGEVVQTGRTIDVNGDVLTTKEITDVDLAKKYRKTVTAKVNGQYVGWGYAPNFIFFKAKAEEFDNVIEEITFWHDYPHGEFCRYHAIILIACGQYEPKDFANGNLSVEDNYKHYTTVRGRELPKSKKQEIKFRSLKDEQGFSKV